MPDMYTLKRIGNEPNDKMWSAYQCTEKANNLFRECSVHLKGTDLIFALESPNEKPKFH